MQRFPYDLHYHSLGTLIWAVIPQKLFGIGVKAYFVCVQMRSSEFLDFQKCSSTSATTSHNLSVIQTVAIYLNVNYSKTVGWVRNDPCVYVCGGTAYFIFVYIFMNIGYTYKWTFSRFELRALETLFTGTTLPSASCRLQLFTRRIIGLYRYMGGPWELILRTKIIPQFFCDNIAIYDKRALSE